MYISCGESAFSPPIADEGERTIAGEAAVAGEGIPGLTLERTANTITNVAIPPARENRTREFAKKGI